MKKSKTRKVEIIPVTKEIQLKGCEIKYMDFGDKILHINLKRYKKNKKTNTITLYDSIADKYGKLIGVEISWDKKGYGSIWADFQK